MPWDSGCKIDLLNESYQSLWYCWDYQSTIVASVLDYDCHWHALALTNRALWARSAIMTGQKIPLLITPVPYPTQSRWRGGTNPNNCQCVPVGDYWYDGAIRWSETQY
eukprot:3250442-Rhodomonas_salina.1